MGNLSARSGSPRSRELDQDNVATFRFLPDSSVTGVTPVESIVEILKAGEAQDENLKGEPLFVCFPTLISLELQSAAS